MLLGIDVGTTGARALLVSEDGTVLASDTQEYPLHTPRPLWAEQDARDWWQGTVAAVRGALSQLEHPGHVTAIGLSGQMHGVVLLDAAGEPVAPAMLWCDGRTEEECREITRRIGSERLIELTANPALAGFSVPKLLWMRRHRPDAWGAARRFLLPKDYIRYKLSGDFATEVSDASGTLLFDVANRRWSQPMLDALELDPSLLPPVHESTVVSTRLSADAARDLGLEAGTPIVGGGGDQAAGAVGAGIVTTGLVSVTVGSSGVVFAHADKPLRDPRGRVHTFCHAVPGAWHVMGVTQGAGLSLRWMRDQIFGPLEMEASLSAGKDPYEVMTERAAAIPAGSDGLVFLPYLMGERTPHLDARARGVFCGLTAAHTQSHMVRSVLEGVAYSLRDCLEILTGMGVPSREVRVAGGGARSSLWRQILADVLGHEVFTINATEGPAYGAALLAGVGTAVWPDVPAACAATVRIDGRVEPHAVAAYARAYPLYRELYERLAPVFPRL